MVTCSHHQFTITEKVSISFYTKKITVSQSLRDHQQRFKLESAKWKQACRNSRYVACPLLWGPIIVLSNIKQKFYKEIRIFLYLARKSPKLWRFLFTVPPRSWLWALFFSVTLLWFGPSLNDLYSLWTSVCLSFSHVPCLSEVRVP